MPVLSVPIELGFIMCNVSLGWQLDCARHQYEKLIGSTTHKIVHIYSRSKPKCWYLRWLRLVTQHQFNCSTQQSIKLEIKF